MNSPDVPATNDPCVQKYLKDHYGNKGTDFINFGNAQQYIQENVVEGATIGAEKIVITQSPGAIGTRIVQAVPGGMAVGNRIGAGLIATGAGLSGAAELAGAIMTPFSTTAMAIARQACMCKAQ